MIQESLSEWVKLASRPHLLVLGTNQRITLDLEESGPFTVEAFPKGTTAKVTGREIIDPGKFSHIHITINANDGRKLPSRWSEPWCCWDCKMIPQTKLKMHRNGTLKS